MGFVGIGEPQIQMSNERYLFNRLCIQRLAKPQNQIATNMQVFSNSQKLIPTKINETTVCGYYNDINLRNLFQVQLSKCISEFPSLIDILGTFLLHVYDV